MREIVGRETELERVRTRFTRRALVLAGEPGIGKTTLWEAGIEAARASGLRVLIARPSGAEAQLSFAGLIDLCSEIELDGLPEPQRDALEVALLRRSPVEEEPPQPHAIGLGLRNALAACAPVLVAIDDLQWLDAASADALAFAARRLDAEAVGFLCARRPGPQSAVERALERRSLERLAVGPLSPSAIRLLLGGMPPDLARRIADATLGNPLFALEVARALPASGAELPVPAAVEDLLGTRVAALGPEQRRLLLAVALSADLHLDELVTIATGATVDAALAAGVLEVDGDRVRASHPLLAAAARTAALPQERRDLHAALAHAVREPEQRALHFALATPHPDAELASRLSTAAARAAARGARPEAVALAEQALRLTPPAPADLLPRANAAVSSPAGAPRATPSPVGAVVAHLPRGDARAERLVALASYLEVLGERQRLAELLLPEVEALPAGPLRVRAWLLLADSGIHTREENAARVDRALTEAGDDPALRKRVLAFRALSTAAEGVERIRDAEAWALEALPELDAIKALGWARALRGRDLDDVCALFREHARPGEQLVDAPEPLAALQRSWRGEIEMARAETSRFLALAVERGEEVSYAWLRLNLTELELRAGEWDAAARLLDEWADTDDGQLLITPTYKRCRALLAAGRGDPEGARVWGEPALAESEARDYRWQVLESSRALGAAALLAGDLEGAAERLRTVWAYCEREGVDDPGAFPVAPDLVEALVELGELDEARALTRRLKGHPWAELTARRCAALIDGGDLAEIADGYERLGLRFDAARCLLAHGRTQRRRRRWKVARDALQAAAERFDALGSPGWADLARGELARVGGRKPRAEGELTETEAQVAELAARGHTNKEIAHALFVTVHTVEAHLSSAYAKLGVRSRAQLALKIGDPGNFAET
ncbi:AAA family ATPase [Solirubrobacter soli]|uniref:AAA family ATPase n=1 Tax=Solirubrobacter soli TaxID=363832 RepID=UPI0003F9A890|nr:AAA family ATPase [Solirubrobacter soli]